MPGYSLLDSEFNDFLFAPIGEETNDMPLTVISALARLDIDPWREAARLTRLPKELATQSLTSTIEGLSSGRWAPSESRVIAGRLVQLLPSRRNSNVSSVAPNSSFRQIRSLAMMWLIYSVVLGALLMVGNHVSPSYIKHTDAHLTNAISPPQPPLRGAD